MDNQRVDAIPYSFTCPTCGGRVDDPGSGPTTRCPYCQNLVPVPEEIRQAVQERQTRKALSRNARYLVIFLIIVIVVPTCIGLFASLVGVFAPLLAMILAFFIGQ